MNDFNLDVKEQYLAKDNEIISFKCDLHENLQKAMIDFIEKHPKWDQYRIIQAAISGFLIQRNFNDRNLTRLYLGNTINFKEK